MTMLNILSKLKFLPNCLVCLRDAASRRAVLSVIDVLAQSQPDAIAVHLPSGLLTCGIVNKGVMPGYDNKVTMLALL